MMMSFWTVQHIISQFYLQNQCQTGQVQVQREKDEFDVHVDALDLQPSPTFRL